MNIETLTPPAHGEYWPGQGGHYICTLPALMGVRARHLIAAAESADKLLTYGPHMNVEGATSHLDGQANTLALLAAKAAGQGGHPAAEHCAGYTADNHTDFFMPAKLDLVMAHICTPKLFRKEGWYLTSTQNSSILAFVQDFENGISDWDDKGSTCRVRPVRVIHL